ncbi:MAG: S24/S26 family peptidase [Acidobacteriota bacterium]
MDHENETVKDGTTSGRAGNGIGPGPVRISPTHLEAIFDLWRVAGRRTEIRVTGHSMFPMLRSGWSLVLEHSRMEPSFGSIIVFLQGRLLVAHRVVGRDHAGNYLTKGDALLHLDRQPVPPNRLVGRVVAVRHNGHEISLTDGAWVRRAMILAVFSRLIGELNRLLRPIRRFTAPTGRVLGFFPGPTRLLRLLNRFGVRMAARRLKGAQSPKPGSTTDPSADGS